MYYYYYILFITYDILFYLTTFLGLRLYSDVQVGKLMPEKLST